MTRFVRTFSLLVAFLGLGLSSLAMATHERWDHDGSRPDEWDNYAIEGQSCSNRNGYQRHCAPGLACEYSNGHGICKRLCNSDYDCHYGESCDFNGYVGVCRHYDDGYGTSPSNPYPEYPASAGQQCSNRGHGYPQCARGLVCQDHDRNGVGICYAQCRAHHECGYGNYCNGGVCAPDRYNRGGRRG